MAVEKCVTIFLLSIVGQNVKEKKMKVGDLVREVGLQKRTGIVMRVIQYSPQAQVIYKVLWNRHSPSLPTLAGPAWPDQLEIVNESR